MNLTREQIDAGAKAYWTSTWAPTIPEKIKWENIEEHARERARASMREAVRAMGLNDDWKSNEKISLLLP